MFRCEGCVWDGLPIDNGPSDAPTALGGRLDPDTVLGAYRHGLISLPATSAEGVEINHLLYEDAVAAGEITVLDGPAEADPYGLAWWSPDPRPVIPRGGTHKARSLMRLLRNRLPWTTTANKAFEQVLAECRADRTPAWLTDDLCAAMVALHQRGWAHSVEVWDGAELVGGVLGVGTGRVFALDTMFHLRTNASKVALLDLEHRLDGTSVRLLDVEWDSDRNQRLGAGPMPRRDFLAALDRDSGPVVFDDSPEEVRRLGFLRPPANAR